MELTATALWLNEFFAGFDMALLSGMHGAAEALGFVLTPLMKLITLLGEKGLLLFLLAFVCMLFAPSRDFGVCVFGAVCCGALITNIILKDTVARPRPFETVEQFRQWWQFVGAPAEDGFSFPSGHVTATSAGMTAISLMKGKKLVLPSVIIVVLMAISRNYLMAHYPSDVLFAMLVGCASGFIAWFISLFIFRFLYAGRERVAIFDLAIEFDIRDVLPFELPFLPAREDDFEVEKAAAPAPARSAAKNSGRGGRAVKKGFSLPSISLPGSYKGKHEKR